MRIGPIEYSFLIKEEQRYEMARDCMTFQFLKRCVSFTVCVIIAVSGNWSTIINQRLYESKYLTTQPSLLIRET